MLIDGTKIKKGAAQCGRPQDAYQYTRDYILIVAENLVPSKAISGNFLGVSLFSRKRKGDRQSENAEILDSHPRTNGRRVPGAGVPPIKDTRDRRVQGRSVEKQAMRPLLIEARAEPIP